MGVIKSLGCIWWINMNQIYTYPGVHCITYAPLEFFRIDLSRVILIPNSLKTFVESIFITSILNVNNWAASVVNYSCNIDHVTESSTNGDLLNTDQDRCRCEIGRVVTSVNVWSRCIWRNGIQSRERSPNHPRYAEWRYMYHFNILLQSCRSLLSPYTSAMG